MMKDPPLLGLNPNEMEFEILRQVKEDSGVSCWRLTHPTIGARSWRKEFKKLVKKWKKARQAAGVLGLEREGAPRGSLRGRHGVLYESEDDSDGDGAFGRAYELGGPDGNGLEVGDNGFEYDDEELEEVEVKEESGDGPKAQAYDSDGETERDFGREYDDGSDVDSWRSVRADRGASSDDADSDLEKEFEAGDSTGARALGWGSLDYQEEDRGDEREERERGGGEVENEDEVNDEDEEEGEDEVDVGGGEEAEEGEDELEVEASGHDGREKSEGEEEEGVSDGEERLRWEERGIAVESRWDSDEEQSDGEEDDVSGDGREWASADSDSEADEEVPRGGAWASLRSDVDEDDQETVSGSKGEAEDEIGWVSAESDSDVSDDEGVPEPGGMSGRGSLRGRVSMEWLSDESESDEELEDFEEGGLRARRTGGAEENAQSGWAGSGGLSEESREGSSEGSEPVENGRPVESRAGSLVAPPGDETKMFSAADERSGSEGEDEWDAELAGSGWLGADVMDDASAFWLRTVGADSEADEPPQKAPPLLPEIEAAEAGKQSALESPVTSAVLLETASEAEVGADVWDGDDDFVEEPFVDVSESGTEHWGDADVSSGWHTSDEHAAVPSALGAAIAGAAERASPPEGTWHASSTNVSHLSEETSAADAPHSDVIGKEGEVAFTEAKSSPVGLVERVHPGDTQGSLAEPPVLQMSVEEEDKRPYTGPSFFDEWQQPTVQVEQAQQAVFKSPSERTEQH